MLEQCDALIFIFFNGHEFFLLPELNIIAKITDLLVFLYKINVVNIYLTLRHASMLNTLKSIKIVFIRLICTFLNIFVKNFAFTYFDFKNS
jgi:hypothetical protein